MAQLKNLIVNGPSKFLGPIIGKLQGGATFSQPVNFTGNEALPQKTLSYVVGIDAFANGGQMGWQSISDIVPKEAESVAWANITGKPSTFAPSAHNQDWSTITGKPTTFAPSSHTHTKSQITDFSHTHSTIEINGIADTTTYGTQLGVVQNSSTGPQSDTWHNSIKILHNNSAGYYTQIAQNFTGTEGLWHRRMMNGTVSSWRHVLDSTNYGDYAVTLTTAQTISGTKTFTGGAKVSGRYAGGGDDEGLVIGRASNDYAGLICGEPSGVRSVFYLLPSSNGNNAAVWRFNNGSASYDIKHPCKAGTIMLTSDTLAWNSITGKPSTYTPSSHTHNYITYIDTRAENTTPDNCPAGLSVHLKATGNDGLNDGGSYHSNTTFKPWGDHSGGPYGQLAFTANQNAWFRTSASGTAWNSWYRLLKSSGISTVTTISLSSYNALTTKDANTMYLITS